MLEDLMEIREHRGENYVPVIHYGAWRVAFLNYHSRFQHGNIFQLERHVLTDETFTLLRGRAVLYISDGDADHVGRITAFRMDPCKVYNIHRGVWHAIEVSRDASVLITENDDTSKDNSPKISVTPEELEAALRASGPSAGSFSDARLDRFFRLDGVLDDLNREAAASDGVPFLRMEDYVHFDHVRSFLREYGVDVKAQDGKGWEMAKFCFRDTREIRSRAGDWDLYALTRHYFRQMSYRTGNLDTPDDCSEKLDWERFDRYRNAREKQWLGLKQDPDELRLLEETETAVTESLRSFIQRERSGEKKPGNPEERKGGIHS